jgi:hypothetical protein
MKVLMVKVLVSVMFLVAMVALSACDNSASSPAKAAAAGVTTEGAKAAAVETAPKPAQAVEKEDRVVVYYFHGDRRCPTCRGIQQTIEQAINERFAAETLSGSVVYKEINTDQPDGKTYVRQFELSFSTMVVATMKGDKTLEWENCNKVWDFATDPAKLSEYTAERIKAALAKIEVK